MGMLEQEIKELRQLRLLVSAGKVTSEEVNAQMAIYAQTEKRAKMILQAYALSAKFGKRVITNIAKTQLIGDGSVIDIDTEVTKETIRCDRQEKIITRMECKEFSQTTGNLTGCQKCDNFLTSRRLVAAVTNEDKTNG